ncbi:hypothetical protein F5Y16DRAFT_424524 [Xylariaceae sp. FL0255]|nr:hypothetical protein F5Y16DRAFT_424524 [Xylariaceae sp. FL0255]
MCLKITLVCTCAHRERHTERCLYDSYKNDGYSWIFTCCMPECQIQRMKQHLERVCKECNKWFYRHYGRTHYKQAIANFLEYKERKGWQGEAIEPRTVPREMLTRHYLDRMPPVPMRHQGYAHNSAMTVTMGFEQHRQHQRQQQIEYYRQQQRPDQRQNTHPSGSRSKPGHWRRPSDTPHPNRALRRKESSTSIDWTAEGVLSDNYASPSTEAPRRPRFAQSQVGPPPRQLLSADPPFPKDANPELFVIDNDDDEEDDEDNSNFDDYYSEYRSEADISPIMKDCPRLKSPQPIYHDARVDRQRKYPMGSVPDEFLHLVVSPDSIMFNRNTPELQHPQPKKGKGKMVKRSDSDARSTSSHVQRLEKAAETFVVPDPPASVVTPPPNTILLNGIWVPKLSSPPPPRSRRATPTPNIVDETASSQEQQKRREPKGKGKAVDRRSRPEVPRLLIPGNDPAARDHQAQSANIASASASSSSFQKSSTFPRYSNKNLPPLPHTPETAMAASGSGSVSNSGSMTDPGSAPRTAPLSSKRKTPRTPRRRPAFYHEGGTPFDITNNNWTDIPLDDNKAGSTKTFASSSFRARSVSLSS